jgi:hypothetical protein
MTEIFLSYRRADSSGHVGRLYDRLAREFGSDRLFRDIELEPGVDFVDAIEHAVAECRVFLAVLGRSWLGPGTPLRTASSTDYMVLEVEAALNREGLTLIPVFVDDVSMPEASDLPTPIRGLARRQALELSESRWEFDVSRLVQVIERAVGGSHPSPPVEPYRPAKGLIAKQAWTAELIESTGATTALRIKLDHEVHTLVWRNRLGGEYLEINGSVVDKTGVLIRGDLHGKLTDGAASWPVVFGTPSFATSKRRLTVGGRILWEG